MCIHLDMMGQLITIACGFLPLSQQLDILPGATHCTLHLPSILDWASDFHVANKDEATQDAELL